MKHKPKTTMEEVRKAINSGMVNHVHIMHPINRLSDAEFALEQALALTIKRMNASLPKDPIVIEINKIINDYFKECE